MKALVSILFLLLVVLSTSGACFQSDVTKLCCPSACAVKTSPKWTQADSVLRSCARGIGCKGVDGWTVGMKCDCGKVK